MSYLELAKKSLDEIRGQALPSTGGGSQDAERATRDQPASDPGQLATMPLEEFARAGLIVKVHSRVLGCDVLFVSDDVPETEIPDLGLTFYRAAEMRKLALLRPGPAHLQRVHAVKEIFGQAYGATITAIESKGSQDEAIPEGSAKEAKEAKKASADQGIRKGSAKEAKEAKKASADQGIRKGSAKKAKEAKKASTATP